MSSASFAMKITATNNGMRANIVTVFASHPVVFALNIELKAVGIRAPRSTNPITIPII
jgi:hypothetical protein